MSGEESIRLAQDGPPQRPIVPPEQREVCDPGDLRKARLTDPPQGPIVTDVHVDDHIGLAIAGKDVPHVQQ